MAVPDTFIAGEQIAASIQPSALTQYEPVLRRLLSGQQLFVKQADGRWRPRGCALGLAQCFAYEDLKVSSAGD
ncbi:hypothetical protein [Ramlibacter sp.]|uniref:hypothetical protein n=1 Tax=Ramlibacter sp. TaxID=1917967 RepID=UPI003D1396B8